MTVRKQWDKYEAAILLDFYLRYLEGALSKKDAIQTVSKRLRTMAKNNNLIIDETYRNISGITFQLLSMESAYKGFTITKPASKLFSEMVALYKNNKEQFDNLLMEAMSMSDELKQDNQDKYVAWLSQKVFPTQLSELYMMYEIIDDFCIKRKVLERPLLQTTELELVKAAQKVVEQNKVFRFLHKREIKRISVAMRHYVTYVKENSVGYCKNDYVVTMKSEADVSEDKENSATSCAEEKNTKEDASELYEVSFAQIDNLAYTHPTYASYFGEEIQNISSWKQLYVNVFKRIYEDYADRIPVNQSFNGANGRSDFCTSENYASMSAPREIVDGKYLETNLSATDIVRKIKRILEICLVDDENLLIKYEKETNNQPSETVNYRTRIAKNANGEAFFEWLNSVQGMAIPTCNSYVSAVNTAERYAVKNGFQHCKLYTNDLYEAQETVNELFNDKYFVEYNNQQHNRFRAGINKLLMYIENGDESLTNQSVSIDLESFITVLIEKFPKGYRIGSHLELKKFKRYWEELYGNAPEMSDDCITKSIAKCGIVHEEKVYMPQIMLDDEMKMKLLSYINDSFRAGKKTIYYEALFKEFSEDFLDHCMYNADMLKGYLIYINDGSYYTNKNFISAEATVNVSTYDEVKNCLVQQAVPMEYDGIFLILSHIPEQKIKNILAQYNEFISNGRNEYFHISIATLSDEELEDIAMIIQSSIDEKRFISGNELIDSIKKKYPYIIERNALLSDKGLRDAIGYKFRDRFSFKGNIISSQGQALSMMEVFADFCKHREYFTLDELKVLKQELDTVIYFEAVYDNSLRISKNEFVAKSHAAFKPEETDAVINRFCKGNYIAIGKIQQFGLFPDAGFSWNSFLLEHYVAMYSPNYKLVHSNYNEGVCVGGIVKKLSDIDTFDELIIDLLAKSGLPLQKDVALQYLCDEGYLARRSYSGIEQLLIKAKELRNQKGF